MHAKGSVHETQPLIIETEGETTTHPVAQEETTTAMPVEKIDQPFVCFNKSAVAPDPKKIYGYFSKDVIIKSKSHIFVSFILKKTLEFPIHNVTNSICFSTNRSNLKYYRHRQQLVAAR